MKHDTSNSRQKGEREEGNTHKERTKKLRHNYIVPYLYDSSFKQMKKVRDFDPNKEVEDLPFVIGDR